MSNKSEQINELAAALAKVQGQLTHASKDSANPFFKSKYADLASVWESCRKLLAANGLSIVQLPDGLEDNCLILDTTMLHSSGQWVSSKIKMPMAKMDPQAYGSTLTYARRYALAAIVGVYQDDDDAEGAKEQPKTPIKANTPTAPQKTHAAQAMKPHGDTAKITANQEKSLMVKCDKEGITGDDLTGLIKWKYAVVEPKDLAIPDFAYLMNNLPKTWAEYVASQSAH